MSIFVGAVMPRQKTAFASEERKRRTAAKQLTATQTRSTRGIGSIRRIRGSDATPHLRLSQEVTTCLVRARRRVSGRPLCPETPAKMAPRHRVRRIGGESGRRCPQSRRAAIRLEVGAETAQFRSSAGALRGRQSSGARGAKLSETRARAPNRSLILLAGEGIILAEAEHDELRGDIRSAHHGQRRGIHCIPAVPMRVSLSVVSDGLPTSLT